MHIVRFLSLFTLTCGSAALAGNLPPPDLSTWSFRELERWTLQGWEPSMAWSPDSSHLAVRHGALGFVEVWSPPAPNEPLMGYYVEDRDHRPFLVEVTPAAEKVLNQSHPFWMTGSVLAATYWCTPGDTMDACPQGGGLWTYDLRTRVRTQILKRTGVTAVQRSTTGDLLLRHEDGKWHIWSQDKDVGIANVDPADNLPTQADRQCSRTWSGTTVGLWNDTVMLVDDRTHQARAVARLKSPWFQDGLPIQPCWSPDGRFISYLDDPNGLVAGKGGPVDTDLGQVVILAVNPR